MGGGVPPRGARGFRPVAVLALAPSLAAVTASAWLVVGWGTGAEPFWADSRMTMSEAAGLSSSGEVVRLVRVLGQDPNQAWPVREGILGVERTVTPLESAVTVRREEMVHVLLRLGARPRNADERAALICSAEASRQAGIVTALLDTGDRSDPRAACPPPE